MLHVVSILCFAFKTGYDMHQAMVAYQGLVHVVTFFLQQEQSTRQTKVPLQRGGLRDLFNRRAHIRHQCRKIFVLSCHRCLIDTGVEKMNDI